MGLRLRALAVVAAILAGILALPALSARAGADSRTVTVVTHDLAPFVVTQNNIRSGFTIDVWDEIAKREGWSTTFVDASGVDGQLKALAEGRADVAAGAISITAGRSAAFDFSQPILNAGLQILVPAETHAEASLPGLRDFLALLFSKSMLVWLGAALALAVIPAHIIWLLERRDADSFVSKSYIPGVLQAFAWSLGALADQNDESPRTWVAHLLQILWGFVAIIFVAYYTATLTSNLTAEKLEAKITSPGDLIGKRVCTVANTTSAAFLKTLGAVATDAPTIGDCYAGLAADRFDATVFDAPVLSYHVAHDGAGAVKLAGPVFQTEDYGFALRDRSELRKPIDAALLAMREDGTYDSISEKWFGTAASEFAHEPG